MLQWNCRCCNVTYNEWCCRQHRCMLQQEVSCRGMSFFFLCFSVHDFLMLWTLFLNVVIIAFKYCECSFWRLQNFVWCWMQHQLMLGHAFDGNSPIGRPGASQAAKLNGNGPFNSHLASKFLISSYFISQLYIDAGIPFFFIAALLVCNNFIRRIIIYIYTPILYLGS